MLKEEGIKTFLKSDFSLARTLFSLAYEEDQNEDTLFLITLCDLASENAQEAQKILYDYLAKEEDGAKLDKIIEKESKLFQEDKSESKTMTYRELSQLLEEGNFEDILEFLSLQASLVVKSKGELFDLINQAIEKKNFAFAYGLIEKSITILDENALNNLLRKIKNYENKI